MVFGKASFEANCFQLLGSAGQCTEMSPKFPSALPQSDMFMINASGKQSGQAGKEDADET